MECWTSQGVPFSARRCEFPGLAPLSRAWGSRPNVLMIKMRSKNRQERSDVPGFADCKATPAGEIAPAGALRFRIEQRVLRSGFWSRGKRSAPKKRSFAGFAPNAKRQRRSFRTGIVAPPPGRLPVLAFFLHDGERWGISGRETESSRKRSFPFPDVPPAFIPHSGRRAPVPPNP